MPATTETAAPVTERPVAPPGAAAEKRDGAEYGADGETVVKGEDFDYPVALTTVVVRDANAALKWYEKALDGKVVFRYDDKEGRVMHAVVKSGFGMVLGVEDYNAKVHMVEAKGEGEEGKSRGCSYVYVTIPKGKGSADECVERMREAGGSVMKECSDLFYGARMGQVVDEFGVCWAFSHKIEEKSEKKDESEKKVESDKKAE